MSIIEAIEKYPKEMQFRVMSLMLMEKTRERKYPSAMMAEITPICTLNCKMCYSHLTKVEVQEQGDILPGEFWIDRIKQSVELGALYVTLSGGEAMTHPDFIDIYTAAYNLNTKVALMTNGTIMNDDLIKMFKDMPSSGINLTMYGFSSETYSKACGSYESFDKIVNNILWMKSEGIKVHLQCTVTHDNVYDLPLIYEFAHNNDMSFMFDSTIKATRNCTAERMNDCSVRKEDMDYIRPIISNMYRKFNGIETDLDEELADENVNYPIKETGMRCGAGNNMFVINWKGEMMPCVTLDVFKVDTKTKSIAQCWKETVEWAENVPQIVECQKCKYRNQCHTCIVYHYYDTGEFGKPSPRICKKIQNSEM